MRSLRPGGETQPPLYNLPDSVDETSALISYETKQIYTEQTNMVKITFQAVSAQKPEKENDEDKIIIPQAHVSLHTLSSFVWCCDILSHVNTCLSIA